MSLGGMYIVTINGQPNGLVETPQHAHRILGDNVDWISSLVCRRRRDGAKVELKYFHINEVCGGFHEQAMRDAGFCSESPPW